MPSYASILSSALLLSASATRAAPLGNHAGLSSPDDAVMILLGLPVHRPCATLRELRERNEGCESETLLFFDELFGGWCPHDEGNAILRLFGRAGRREQPRQTL
ncbi:hypothetical protein H2248_004700 [Termitomyces sp. 'cryptogamus']|nr:hypothetical protein H2248_004700 [Termitomyces sp. 'cryptogamus']